LFLSLTIFGVGVTIIDFLGIFDSDGSNLSPEKSGFKIISKLMNALRNIVYFSLGFGPTGLFASFNGLTKTSGLIWAVSVGAGVMILARLLKRFIRKDLDSSIKPDDLLQENGVLLLPLEGDEISKAAVRQYGREIEIFVRCKDPHIKIPKGKEIIIEEYDNDVYWIRPVE